MSKNPNQIVKDFDIGRNDPCPCGSGKKLKKCCGTKWCAASRRLLNWLKQNDPQPPVDYNTVTPEELADSETLAILKDRYEEVKAMMPSSKPETFKGVAAMMGMAIAGIL
jgi:hypothetical protein